MCEINNNHIVTSLFHHKTKQHRTSLSWTEQHCGTIDDCGLMETVCGFCLLAVVEIHWLIWTIWLYDPQIINKKTNNKIKLLKKKGIFLLKPPTRE